MNTVQPKACFYFHTPSQCTWQNKQENVSADLNLSKLPLPTSVKKPAIPAWHEPCSSPYFFLYSRSEVGEEENKSQSRQSVPAECNSQFEELPYFIPHVPPSAEPQRTPKLEPKEENLRNSVNFRNVGLSSMVCEHCQNLQLTCLCWKGTAATKKIPFLIKYDYKLSLTVTGQAWQNNSKRARKWTQKLNAVGFSDIWAATMLPVKL